MRKSIMIMKLSAVLISSAFLAFTLGDLSSRAEEPMVDVPEAINIADLEEEGDAAEDVEEEKEPEDQAITWAYDLSDEECYMLARVAMAEAEGEDTEGKALVMLVVLNRMESEAFPDTVEEVIFQNDGDVHQFSTIIDGGRYWSVEPNEDCWAALEMVMAGWNESQGATYFEADYSAQTWHKENLQYLFQHGAHVFYTEEGSE